MAGFLFGAIVGGTAGYLIGRGATIQYRRNPRPEDFKPGELVFYDSFAGLVPAKYVGVSPPKPLTGTQAVMLKVTSSRHRPYKKGETVEVPLSQVVKRSWVHRRGGQVKIIEPRRG